MTTEEIWKQLDDKVFAHINVSYIINLGHIRAIDGDEVDVYKRQRLHIRNIMVYVCGQCKTVV